MPTRSGKPSHNLLNLKENYRAEIFGVKQTRLKCTAFIDLSLRHRFPPLILVVRGPLRGKLAHRSLYPFRDGAGMDSSFLLLLLEQFPIRDRSSPPAKSPEARKSSMGVSGPFCPKRTKMLTFVCCHERRTIC